MLNKYNIRNPVIYRTIICVFLMINTLLLLRTEFRKEKLIHVFPQNGLLEEAIETYKAYECKETLPYSTHQFNTTFVICLKEGKNDPMVSTYFLANGYIPMAGFGKENRTGTSKRFEEHLINIWLNLLDNYPEAVVLDMGSNIGAYTLASRAMGNPVISVDANPQNHALLYNSLVLNGFDGDSIQILNAISDGHYEYHGADGDGTLLDSTSISNKKYSLTSMSSITVFDIFDNLYTDVDTFILKLDIQGFECKALRKFLELEVKPKFVPYIQMEIIMHCDSVEGGRTSPCVETFKTEFLPLLEKSGYTPHVPWPITYEELKRICYYDVLFFHKEAKAFPYWNKHLSQSSFLINFQGETDR